MVPPPFPELLDAARSGEQAAYAELWHTYSPRIHGFLRAQRVQEPGAMTNEVFDAVFRSIHDFRGGADAFCALLFTVARRRVIDERRRSGRTPQSAAWSADDDTRVARSAEELALEASGSDRVRQLLERLSRDQREVLLLRIYGDMTVDQIAGVLHKRAGAVKALQRRGLARLRDLLELDLKGTVAS